MHLDLFRSPQVLVACERSGIVRDAFLRRGFDAWSCDVEADERRSNRHIQCDVRDVLGDGWDLLIVAHPPCTRLCKSGLRWLHTAPPGRTLPEMWEDLDRAASLFSTLWQAPVPYVAIENPMMHRHAQVRITNYCPPAQVAQPWWFGDPVFKGIGLWLRKLRPLRPTRQLQPPARGTDQWKRWSRIHRMPGNHNRQRERSRFFPGIAAAMAEQWGDQILSARRKGA
ncbi:MULTISPECIES: hypothetical protein [unclassified Sphingomonas]|uniref:hypothetical protein n=1 Tax=unclassified Sphingomonas TaxID=196159 RepID=UPI000701C99E|nr:MULTISPECIES: hypothetical protein [unclassified Sphingomonas]KQX19363.1 hypothetical protein ASD17_12540 [Sphingomonas sp. Root1294]KQY65566.1 hypothetical protein ASD39_15740 [Sphingomonas sp. Root50]KRB95133.1 hypothetical protein ASE22_04315 [Sphingomonas sp. Root720]